MKADGLIIQAEGLIPHTIPHTSRVYQGKSKNVKINCDTVFIEFYEGLSKTR